MLETNVHFPTDINLLWDSVRKCIDIIEKINQKHPLGGWRKSQNWRNRFKKVKLYLERANRGGGKNKEQRLLRFAQQYLDLGFRLEEKIFASIKEVGSLPVVANINKQLIELEDFHAMVMHHLLLVHDRLIEDKVIDHQDKYFSIFERHTEWINKGKSGNRIGLGHVVLVSADQNRLILDYQVLEKQSEKEGLLDSVSRLLDNYEEPIVSLSTDRGFYVRENKELLESYIEDVCIPKPGKKTVKQREEEQRPRFKELRCKHSSIESIINSLEHHGLNRCLHKGIDGFQRYVGYGILAYNLHQIGNQLHENETLKEEKLKRKLARN